MAQKFEDNGSMSSGMNDDQEKNNRNDACFFHIMSEFHQAEDKPC